jgi:DNA-binding NarL/FixJ family response regulator
MSTGSAAQGSIQILLVQDHPLLASTIARILSVEADLNIGGIARTGADAAAAAVQGKADVVLMDFQLSDMSGPAAAALILSQVPRAAIVFHNAEDSEAALLDAIDAGAIAYLTKSTTADQIVEAVRRAGRGEVLIPVSLFAKAIKRQNIAMHDKQVREQNAGQFTRRELEVLKLLADGLDTTTMATHLGIAVNTVEWHQRHVIEKLHVHSKLQAVVAAARMGLIELTEP